MSTASAYERVPQFTVGDRLRKAREETGLDQSQFGQEIGVSRGTISNYESAVTVEGLKKPYLMAWAMRSNVPFDWILTGKVPGDGAPDDGDIAPGMPTGQYPYQKVA